MKSIRLITVFMMLSASSFCQQKATQDLTKESYLHKSKVQKTIGFVFLGSGAILVVTGGIIQNKSFRVNGTFLNFDGLGYQFAGLLCGLSSIPFFISASKNKRKSMTITLNTQEWLMPAKSLVFYKCQPAITVKFNF